MTTQFPKTIKEMASSPAFLKHLRETGLALSRKVKQDPNTAKAYTASPMDAFLAQAPQDLRAAFPGELRDKGNKLITASQGAAGARMLAEAHGGGDVHKGILSACCQIGLWTAVVAALAGLIAVSQGAAIAPLIAMDAGILPVLAAITGLSEGTITAMAAGGGFTLGQLIDAACD